MNFYCLDNEGNHSMNICLPIMQMKYTRTTITTITTKIAIAIKSPAANDSLVSSSVSMFSLVGTLEHENDAFGFSLSLVFE